MKGSSPEGHFIVKGSLPEGNIVSLGMKGSPPEGLKMILRIEVL